MGGLRLFFALLLAYALWNHFVWCKTAFSVVRDLVTMGVLFVFNLWTSSVTPTDAWRAAIWQTYSTYYR